VDQPAKWGDPLKLTFPKSAATMARPISISLAFQNKLRGVVRDDWTLAKMVFSPMELVENPNGPQFISLWQTSVDFIYLCLKSHLIRMFNYDHCGDTSPLLDDL
jgi:hypothetical protein